MSCRITGSMIMERIIAMFIMAIFINLSGIIAILMLSKQFTFINITIYGTILFTIMSILLISILSLFILISEGLEFYAISNTTILHFARVPQSGQRGGA